MADEVVKTMTNEDFTSVVADRICQNETEIIQCLCPDTLVPHLASCALVDLQEEGELFLRDPITRKESAKHLLALLASKGPEAYLQFLGCLEKETSHMGHAYIASLLRGEEFGNEEEDLFYNKSETAEAKRFAKLALDIAKENNFKTEVASARARLSSL